MKKLSTSFVAVKKITSQLSRSQFVDNDLEKAARLILEAEGLINPIILRRTSLESYEVVNGDFEYHAAARAREIDPRKGETIGAFILEPENEEVLLEQIKIIRKIGTTENVNRGEQGQSTSSIEQQIVNLETRFEKRNNELRTELLRLIEQVKDEVKEMKNQLPQQLEPLEAFNELKPGELINKLRSVGIIGKTAEKIIDRIEKQRKQKKFESLSDVVARVEGLSDKKMVTIIDSWSKNYV